MEKNQRNMTWGRSMRYLQLWVLPMGETMNIIHQNEVTFKEKFHQGIGDGYDQDVVHCQYSVVESEVIFLKVSSI